MDITNLATQTRSTPTSAAESLAAEQYGQAPRIVRSSSPQIHAPGSLLAAISLVQGMTISAYQRSPIHRPRNLSPLAFCRSLDGIAQESVPHLHFAPSTGDADEATSLIERISTWENKPDALERLNDPGRTASELESRHYFKVVRAMTRYQSGGVHVLMNAILQGHQTLEGFLAAVAPGMFSTPEKVEEFCRDFAEKYNMTEVDGSKERICHSFSAADELQQDARLLGDFLRSAETLPELTLFKGLKAFEPEAQYMSTAVCAKDYLRAALGGHLIQYQSFLSTSLDWDEAVDFATIDPVRDGARYAISLADKSPEAEELRKRALAELNESQASPSIMLALRTVGAKGCALDAYTDVRDEKEVLLAPGHIVRPDLIICGENSWVILGVVTMPPPRKFEVGAHLEGERGELWKIIAPVWGRPAEWA